MKDTFLDIWGLVSRTGRRFNEDDPIMLAGSLAFFTVFAIPPILIMIIFSIGLFTGQSIAMKETFNQIQALIGQASAEVLQNIVEHYFVEGQNVFQRILRIGIFVFASSSFFLIIQHALNQVWSVQQKSNKNILKVLENRVLSFGIILVMGIILAISLGSQSLLISIRDDLNQLSPFFTPFVLITLSIILSLAIGTLCFGVIFKFLPDVIIEWKVVWVGASITSFLFLIGKFIIGFALNGSSVEAMYGVAGSTAIFLLWVFYSSIILFFGAKITQQYALSFAETIQPKPHAVKIETKEVK